MDDVIVFQSVTFPAVRAADPEAGNDESAGVALLQYILDAIEGESLSVRGSPIMEGSGCGAVVEYGDNTIAIHLTWFPARCLDTPEDRDMWTIQIWRSGGWCRELLRKVRGQADRALVSVFTAVTGLLRAQGREFSDVRVCKWSDLDEGLRRRHGEARRE